MTEMCRYRGAGKRSRLNWLADLFKRLNIQLMSAINRVEYNDAGNGRNEHPAWYFRKAAKAGANKKLI